MKTFRCVFLNKAPTKTVDVVAPDARTAASRAVAQFPGLPFQRLEVEDDRGLAYMWCARTAGEPDHVPHAA